jgi:hypothetical protein
VGDFQGDDEAEVDILVEGGAVMRRCDSQELVHWDIESPAIAVIQAGVNAFGPSANTSLFGQSVARASWTLIVPSGTRAPANGDLNLEQLEDIVLELAHRALPRRDSGSGVDISCLAAVGAGSGAGHRGDRRPGLAGRKARGWANMGAARCTMCS